MVTKNNKTETYLLGYYPYSQVLKEVNQNYKDGADAVVLEMLTEKQFNSRKA
jgi:hypothetical protein|tara:strand:+ start:374 stop:529 length:156 start_codon:yes stop_codon:yes gene_type:complete